MTDRVAGRDHRTALVLGSLATWRVSHLVVHEDGPAQAVVRLRAAVDRTPLAGVMDCFGCTSVWVGAALAPLVVRGRPTGRDVVLTALALSGAACLLERLTAGHDDDAAAGGGGPLPEPTTESPLVEVLDP